MYPVLWARESAVRYSNESPFGLSDKSSLWYPGLWSDMAYELFDSKAAKIGSPQLTIRGGRIAFNADAGEVLSKSGKFAHLLWDGAASRLAIRPLGKEDARAFKLSFKQGLRGGTISAHSFLKYIRWNATSPVAVSAEWNDRERILEALLPREHVGSSAQTQESHRKTKKRV
jgi:hypothetical protein